MQRKPTEVWHAPVDAIQSRGHFFVDGVRSVRSAAAGIGVAGRCV